jgi:hypothetical protein
VLTYFLVAVVRGRIVTLLQLPEGVVTWRRKGVLKCVPGLEVWIKWAQSLAFKPQYCKKRKRKVVPRLGTARGL